MCCYVFLAKNSFRFSGGGRGTISTKRELQRPNFDRFRYFFICFKNNVFVFTSKKYENPYCSFYLLKNRPWNHVKSLDLAICYKFHQSRAPETFMRPTWWKKKVNNLQKSVSYTVFLVFCYEDGFLATWDPSQMKDLKIPHLMVVLKPPFDGIWPSLCRFKVTKIMFLGDKTTHNHKPLFPTSFAFKEITNGKMGNAIYLLFLH